jgi:hypothetical protein
VLGVFGGGSTKVPELEWPVYEVVAVVADGEIITVVGGVPEDQGRVVVRVAVGGWGMMTTVWEIVIVAVDVKADIEFDSGGKSVEPEDDGAEL